MIHNHEVAGSIPAPATKETSYITVARFSFMNTYNAFDSVNMEAANLSLPLILERMQRTDGRFMPRAATMAKTTIMQGSKQTSSKVIR